VAIVAVATKARARATMTGRRRGSIRKRVATAYFTVSVPVMSGTGCTEQMKV
jgi:hypothetical protein